MGPVPISYSPRVGLRTSTVERPGSASQGNWRSAPDLSLSQRRPSPNRNFLLRGGWRSRGHRRRSSNLHRRTVIHQVLQFFARLEERDLLRRNFHPIARLWIPSHARLALSGSETAKTTDFDLVANPQ